jgi:transcription elongation factor Elf1
METVKDEFKCPVCGENNVDKLELDEEDYVTCLSCGKVYDIN